MSKKEKATPRPKAKPAAQGFNRKHLLPLGIIAVVAFALYAKTLSFDFVYHDDDTMIPNNALLLENATLKTAFTTDAWFRSKEVELYRPWQSLTYIIDYKLWQAKPTGYHLHNLVTFILVLVVLYFFLQNIKFSERWALLLTLFYACHYLFAHTVSWIPARGDLYLALFGLLATNSFLNYTRKPETKELIWANVLLFFALLSKETAIVILPAVLLLRWAELKFDFKQLKSITGLWLLPSVLPIALYFLLRHNAVAQSGFVSLSGGLYNLPVVPESVFKFFVPYAFCVLPGYTPTLTIAGSVLLLAVTATIMLLRKSEKVHLLLAGFVMFLLTLLPSLFYKPDFSGYAYDYLDHRMLFAGIGLLIFAGALLTAFPLREKVLQYVLIGACVIEAAFSFNYQNAYKDFNSYYQNAVSNNPKSGLAMLNYGILLRLRENKLQESNSYLTRGIQAYPDSLIFVNEKAGNYFTMGKLDSMLSTAQQLSQSSTWQYEGLIYKAVYYGSLNPPITDSAMSIFTQAIALKPKNAFTYLSRAKLYKQLKNANAAITDLDEAIRLNPGYTDALFERGNMFANLGYFDKAVLDFERCVNLQPDNRDAYYYLGQCYVLSNRKIQGCNALQQAANMGQPDALAKMGQLCK